MSEIIAYDEITLLDIADTATYIYYSENIDGTGASLAPSSTTIYIGIYSGPSFPDGQPQIPPSETVWSRYVGEKGEKGDKGEDANTYYIETNQEEILRFVNSDNTYSYSPERLTFKIFNNPKQPGDDANDAQISLTKDNYQLEVIGEAEPISKDNSYLRLGFQISAENTEDIGDPKTVYFNIKDYLDTKGETKSSLIFRFSYILNNKVAAIKIIEMRNGVSEDMANFSIHANGITAAIQNTKLNFSAEGLKILNGGINIVNKENQSVFFGDTNGNLTLSGTIYANDGEFTGTVHATDGDFTGKIIANSGLIGGLTISNEALYAGADKDSSSLVIEGAGKIYAQNIILGDEATIKNQIKLGEAYIYNPVEHNGNFLQAGNVILSQNGLLKLGEIEAFGGTNSYIKSGNELSFWQINGDGTANFKEIIVDKATIKNSILEIGSIQAVGSLMLFKDSWRVERVEGSNFILESSIEEVNLVAGDFITDGNNYYKIKNVLGKTITLEVGGLSVGQIITKIGKTEDFVMAILGDNTGQKDYAVKNSLTISKVNEILEGRPIFNKTLILGDLTDIDSNYGTGLYAENVFLNGTLTTKASKTSYAGVNTLTGATTNKFENTDVSKIIFWAGSEGTSADNIREAKFQVTEAGSIYASQGRFEGSLITKSVIKGSSIHTAKIYGEENNMAAPLQIYSTKEGIQFIKDETSQEIQLEIRTDGLYSEGKSFIELGQDIKYLGLEAKYSNKNSLSIIRPNYIGFDSNVDSIEPAWKIEQNDGFIFSKNNFSIFEIKNDIVTSNQKVEFKNNVVFGEDNSGMLDYQKAENGYNLFVR